MGSVEMLKSATVGESSQRQGLRRRKRPIDMTRRLRRLANRQNKGLFCQRELLMISSRNYGIQFFKLIGRHIITMTMNSDSVVKSLYVLKNELVGVAVILNVKPFQPLAL